MAVTQKDIAKKMGLSPSLVSRVLSGRAREVAISEETIETVTRLAEEMGYVPNIAAQSLKGIPTRTIGVMVGFFNDPFFGQIIDALLQYAEKIDYSVVLAGYQHQHEPSTRELRPLLKHQLDGIIIVGSSQHTEWTRELSIPVAHVGHGPTDEFSSRISIDENKAMRQLLEHLKSEGCTELGFMGFDSLVSHTRRNAVIEHATALNLNLSKEHIAKVNSNVHTDISTAVDKLLQTSPTLNGIVCATDKLALYLTAELKRRNISVPAQIAVTGVDDIPFADLATPRLTTIHQPVSKLVQMAFEAVTTDATPQQILLEPELIIRESSLLTSASA